MAKVVGFDEKAKKQVTCWKCSAIIEYTQHEVRSYNGRDYSGGSDGKEWIVCPNCGGEATIRSW